MQPSPFAISKQNWIPHPFQEEGMKMMLGQACAGLLMDPGLGKTVTALTAFKILKDKGYVRKMLVIAPLRVVYSVWPKELEKWAHLEGLTIGLLHGAEKENVWHQDYDIYCINPEGCDWLFNKMGLMDGCDVLCVDESTKFKNSGTKRFKAMRKWISKFRRRWILTGTPAPNGLHDLFGQIYILDEGAALGSYVTHFRRKYFSPGYDGYSWEIRPDSAERIVAAVDPLVMRFKADDWLDLPPIIYDDIIISMPPEAELIYSELEDHFYAELGDLEIVALNAAAVSVKCRQVLNGAVYGDAIPHRPSKREVHLVHDAKLNALKDLLEQLQGQPAFCLYEFDHDRQRICSATGAPAIGGGTSPQRSAELIRLFSSGQLPLLVAHPASAGHGIDGLQDSCHHVICFGLTWDLEMYYQAIRRIARQGNTAAHIIIHRILVENSLDMAVAKILMQKEVTQENFLQALRTFRPTK